MPSTMPATAATEVIVAATPCASGGAFARAALVLGGDAYSLRAQEAASFILSHLRNGDGRLQRSYKDGRAEQAAYLDDYAFLIGGLLDLFEASGEPRWLDEAAKLDAVVEAHYEDKKSGGFYLTSDDAERLLARERPTYDGAEPSGLSIEVTNLLRLAELSGRPSYRERAERALRAVGETLRSSPAALSHLLQAVDFYLDAPKEIVIVTPRSRADASAFLARLRGTCLPNRVLVVVTTADIARLRAVVPLVEGKQALGGKPTA